jgi:hypothetical protein
MSSVLDRLTDAMSAAASTVREPDLRPLAEPRRRPGGARWRQPAWAAPVAAAAAVALVIGLTVSLSNGMFGARQARGPASLPAAPLRFYITIGLGLTKVVVRSTATGRVVATVPVALVANSGSEVAPALATAANGTFYLAAFERGVQEEQIYRFQLTAAGHVTGFARVPGGGLRSGWAVDALAASANGSRIAVGAYYYRSHVNPGPEQSDQVVVINAHTGAQRVWQGGSLAGGHNFFRVASLSWTSGRHGLAVLGQWCRAFDPNPGGEECPPSERQAQLRAINPAGPAGGSVVDGRLLLGQAPRTFLAQALVSPDGSVITAMVLRGKIIGNKQISGGFPANLSVVRISVATGYEFSLLYRRYLGDTSSESGPMNDALTLIADATGNYLILNGGICNLHCSNEFNGWLDGRQLDWPHVERLVPLRPAGFAHREAAETW